MVWFLGASRPAGRPGKANGSMNCLYARGGISGLEAAERALAVTATCTTAFDGAATWTQWENPWFANATVANDDWGRWVAAKRGRRLVVDVPLIPSQEAAVYDWRSLGAQGTFSSHARELATALVRAGLGDSFIRLGNESNGPWERDWIGASAGGWLRWREFWRQTVFAMRSVAGAHFRFIWCISPAVGHVPFREYYPGSDVVDVVGMDVYDSGFTYSGGPRWEYLINQPNGVLAIRQFASEVHEPLAIPEWGLIPTPTGAGDDPGFVRGVAGLSRENRFVLQSYFYAGPSAGLLTGSPGSVAAYRRGFAGSHSGQ